MSGMHGFRDEQGAVAVIVAAAMVMLIGFVAIVVDVGALYEDRRQLQTAADAGALAGVQDLPVAPARATAAAGAFSDVNYARTPVKDIQVTSTYVANDTVRVQLTDPEAPLYLARVWGHTTSAVHAEATAIVSSPSAYGHGVMPFGMMSRDPSGTAAFGYEFEVEYMLKSASQEGTSGNFQFVSLTEDSEHAGGNFIYDALSSGGVPNPVYIGRDYFTKTGINGSRAVNELALSMGCAHTFWDAVERSDTDGAVNLLTPGGEDPCKRVVVVPIIINPEYPEGDPRRYNWSELMGSKLVRVIGFANFFVTSWGSSGNDCWVKGKFIRPVDEEALDFGPLTPWGSIHFRMID